MNKNDIKLDNPYSVTSTEYKEVKVPGNLGNSNYLVARTGNGKKLLIPKDFFYEVRGAGANEILSNLIVLDTVNNKTMVFGKEGNLMESLKGISQSNLRWVNSQNPEFDIFGEPVIDDSDEIDYLDSEKQDEKTKNNNESFPDRLKIELKQALQLIRCPRKYFNKEYEPELESPWDLLIQTCTLKPDQFDEIFTVSVHQPESPLMKIYLNKLAELVLEEMSKVEDQSFDNIEELEKLAFSNAGYQGKTLEIVRQESKDYHKYFRYLLTKGDKITITEEQEIYFNELSKVLKGGKYVNLKFKNSKIDVEIHNISSTSAIFSFKGKIPILSIGSGTAIAKYFLYVNDINNVEEEIEKSTLPIRIALNNELILKVAANCETLSSIVVCDKEYNCVDFHIKPSTMNKYTRICRDKMKSVDIAFKSGSKIPLKVVECCI